jgi:hypothetical protein
LVTLVTMSTGESWNDMMYEVAGASPDKVGTCTADPTYDAGVCAWRKYPQSGYDATCRQIDGCGSWVAYPFFLSFSLLISFVFINLFVAVIIEGTSNSSELEAGNEEREAEIGESVGLTEEEYVTFTNEWVKHDTAVVKLINEDGLHRLMAKLPPPLGFGLPDAAPLALHEMRLLMRPLRMTAARPKQKTNLPAAEQVKLYYTFDSVCLALAKRMLAHIVAAEGVAVAPKRSHGPRTSGEDTPSPEEHGDDMADMAAESGGGGVSEFLQQRQGGLVEAIEGREVDFAARQVAAIKLVEEQGKRRQLMRRRNSLTGPRKLVSRTVH